MELSSRLSPRTTIYGVVIVLTGLALLLSGLMALYSYREYQTTHLAQKATEAGLLIQRANYYYAMERGFTAASIASRSNIPTPSPTTLRGLRGVADQAVEQALALVGTLRSKAARHPLLGNSLREFTHAHDALLQARAAAKAVTTGGPPPLTPSRWIEIATLHIRRAAQLRNAVSASITAVPVDLRSYWVLDSWIWQLGEFAGRERAVLAAFIAAEQPIDSGALTSLGAYRRVVDSHLAQITALLADGTLDSRLRDGLKAITQNFGTRFEKVREDIYRAAPTGEYPMNAASWLNLSTAAINSMLHASETIGNMINEELAAELNRNRLRLVLSVVAVGAALALATLGFLGVASGARRLEEARESAENHLHETRQEAAARRQAESALRNLVEKNPVGALVVDDERHVLFANGSAQEMLGTDLAGLRAAPPKLPLLVGVKTEHAIQRPGRSGGVAELTVTDTEWDDCHAYLVMLRDITDAKLAELSLQHLSRHDPLTGLPNHTLFMDRLEQALIRARRFVQALRIVVIDIDRFRFTNETLGHAIGDRLLRTSAERLRAAVRETDTVARIGSDQFAVLLENLADGEAAQVVLDKIAATFKATFQLLEKEVQCTASIGFSDFPRDTGDAETLVRYADIALQSAKQSGGNTVRSFSADLHAKAASRPQLQQALAGAIARDELSLHYQPRIDLPSGQVIGMEALLRWHHPELGFVSPAEFIPIAEESGLIVSIGDWVLHTACTQTRAWHRAGLPMVTVSVNLSALQLAQYDIVDNIAQTLDNAELPPHHLELEITESALIHNAESAADKLNRLRDLGVHCSIDDFGTGYSSLSYLRQLPIHALKVDQSFIHKVSQDTGNAAITTAVISMARDLNLRVVAEGVETEEDAAYLRQLGCNEVQGYYFARPLPTDEFAAYLAQPSAPPIGDPARDQEHRTLLIIDDDIDVVRALVRLLRNDGYNILTATEPEEAFKQLARHRTGLIISDLRMPRMSGVEFLKRCRQLHPQSARMILSGADDREAVMASINEVGIDKYLTKPWDDTKLRYAIRAALNPSPDETYGAGGSR